MNSSTCAPLIIERTDALHPDFRALVRQLDAELAVLNGAADAFYNQYNGLESIRHVVLARRAGVALGCGAIKELEPGTMEVKRMFVPVTARRQGIAENVLHALETWARELGYQSTQLETGTANIEALALYEKCGYTRIPNYGQYAGVAGSVCFKKVL